MATLLAAVCILEALAIVVLVGALVYLYREFTKAQRDLLNRLMARNLGEYTAVTPEVLPRRRTRTLNDEQAARREQERHGQAVAG